MSITAIVLVRAERTLIPETAERLAAVPFVSEVYSVTGEWDIVVLLRLPRYEDLAEAVTEGLRRVPGLERTTTMLAFRSHSSALLDRAFNIGLEEDKAEIDLESPSLENPSLESPGEGGV